MTIYKKIFELILIFTLGIILSILIYNIMANGPGVEPDSITYMEAAKNFISGKGLYAEKRALTHFPPLYPILMGTLGYLSDIDLGNKVMLSFFYGINFVMICLIIVECTDYQILTILSIFIYYLLSTKILLIHSYALSEPFFIFIYSMAMYLLILYIKKIRLFLLVISGLFIGILPLIRYIGISLIPPFLLITILTKNNNKDKIKIFVIGLILTLMPITLWIARNLYLAGSATNRYFSVHLVEYKKIKNIIIFILENITPKILHNKFSFIAFLVIMIIIITATIFAWNKKKNKIYIVNNINIIIKFGIFSIMFYLGFLIISASFFDAAIPFNYRLLTPLIFIILIIVYIFAYYSSYLFNKKIIWHMFLLYMMYIGFSNYYDFKKDIEEIYYNGLGYNNIIWKKSDTISFLKNNIIRGIIYSNGHDVIWYFTNNESKRIPIKVNPNTRIINNEYKKEIEEVYNEINKGNAILVYFKNIKWRWYLPQLEEIIKEGKIPQYKDFTDGIIFGIKENQ